MMKAFDIVGPNAPQNVKDAWMGAAKQALYSIDHPLAPAYRSIEAEQARIREREFYVSFLERLEKL